MRNDSKSSKGEILNPSDSRIR